MYTKGEWKSGYNPNVTRPTTPNVGSPVCGGMDWPYRTINVGTETIAICPAQDTNRTHQPDTVEMEANARLISASPDLYEACRELLSEVKIHTTQYDLGMKALAERASRALAKAEGK